jgi:phenylpyruvate tautomerase
MPVLKLQTNLAVVGQQAETMLRQASAAAAELLGKPERYVVAILEADTPMTFGGTTAPAAYLELKSIGLPRERTPELSRKLTDLVAGGLGVSPDRIYIEFSDSERDLWGWNGATF